MASDTEARVQQIISNLRSLDKARELFAELNYDPAHDLISRKGWGETIANTLAEDPQVIASHEDFKIIYARLDADSLLLGDERPVVNRLLNEYPYLLCLFSDSQQQQWHFVNIRYDEEIKKRRLFRRITVGPGERLRTATERLSLLDLERIRPDLVGIYPLDIQTHHDEAFDVEAVTKDFYNTFVDLFHLLKDEIAGNNPTYRDDAPIEAQMILSRLLFLYFIQKKGWLDGNPHYLYERFQELYTKDPSGHTFYSDFLILLFQKLSNEQLEFKDLGDVPFLNGGLFEIEPFHSKLPFDLKISNRTFRSVFERMLEHFNFTVREDTPLDVEVAIDPEMLGRIFENLILQLERDRDLRKMTGSYYTPRVIVHFMCQQSLKEYLASESQIDPTKLEMLLEFNPPDQLEDWEVDLLKDIVSIPEARTLRDMAKRVFVLDPAVGSGAFLVGMLHEVLTLIKHMDIREHSQEYIARRNYDYELKRDIIENCLYGVDILEQAVRICELRLWLSLVVDYEKEPEEEVPPLPNLSYQVRQGDSLIETLFGQRVRLDALTRTEKGRQLIDEIQQEKHAYFLTRGLKQKRQKELNILVKQCELAEILVKEKRQTLGTKQRLFGDMTDKEAIEKEEVRQQASTFDNLLRSAQEAKQKAQAWLDGKLAMSSTDIDRLRQQLGISFIWRLDFAEVFKAQDGFDIIIQNPPYVNMVEMEYRPDLYPKEIYKQLYSTASGGFDLFILFHEISVRLLRTNGIASIICPNKFLGAEYAKQLRKWLGEHTKLISIADVSAAKPFDAAVYPVITLYQKKDNSDSLQPYDIGTWRGQGTSRESVIISKRGDVTSNLTTITADQNWSLVLQDVVDIFVRLFEEGKPLGMIADITGGASVSEAYDFKEYVIDATVKDLKSSRYVPLIVSGNIRRYYTTWGIEKTQYINSSYSRPMLDIHADVVSENRHLQITSPKLIISGMSKRPRVIYDPGRAVAAKSTVIVYNSSIDLKYLCGILNSELYAYIYYCLYKSLALGGGYLRFGPPQIKTLPIVKTADSWVSKIIKEVDEIGKMYDYGEIKDEYFDHKITAYASQIDSLVYDLHGIDEKERHIINEIVLSLAKDLKVKPKQENQGAN